MRLCLWHHTAGHCPPHAKVDANHRVAQLACRHHHTAHTGEEPDAEDSDVAAIPAGAAHCPREVHQQSGEPRWQHPARSLCAECSRCWSYSCMQRYLDVLSAPGQATHPALADSADLHAFLEDNEGEWQVEVHPSLLLCLYIPASSSSCWPQFLKIAWPAGPPQLPPAWLREWWWKCYRMPSTVECTGCKPRWDC